MYFYIRIYFVLFRFQLVSIQWKLLSSPTRQPSRLSPAVNWTPPNQLWREFSNAIKFKCKPQKQKITKEMYNLTCFMFLHLVRNSNPLLAMVSWYGGELTLQNLGIPRLSIELDVQSQLVNGRGTGCDRQKTPSRL